MNQHSDLHILTFTLLNKLFAVDVTAVKEIVWLPELVTIEEAPPLTVGVFNLRGRIIPVIDLNIYFGNPQEHYSISDRIIIINVKVEFGLIVNDVHNVTIVPVSALEPSPAPHLIAGELKLGEDIVMLIDHLAVAEFVSRKPELRENHTSLHHPHDLFNAPVFNERSKALKQQSEEADSGKTSMAVVSLYHEYFAVDLEVVKEFIEIPDVTPVPCTPAHVIGDINLRGEILTLIDISGLLNETTSGKWQKAIIAHVNELVAGIAVNDVIEVININPADIRPVPSSVAAMCQEYIKGEFPYHGKMLSILDLKKILASKKIVVEA